MNSAQRQTERTRQREHRGIQLQQPNSTFGTRYGYTPSFDSLYTQTQENPTAYCNPTSPSPRNRWKQTGNLMQYIPDGYVGAILQPEGLNRLPINRFNPYLRHSRERHDHFNQGNVFDTSFSQARHTSFGYNKNNSIEETMSMDVSPSSQQSFSNTRMGTSYSDSFEGQCLRVNSHLAWRETRRNLAQDRDSMQFTAQHSDSRKEIEKNKYFSRAQVDSGINFTVDTPLSKVDRMLNKQNDGYGILLYTINTSVEVDEHGIVKSHKREKGEPDSQYIYEKFCLPEKWKTQEKITLKNRVIDFVDSYQNNTIWAINENNGIDSNFRTDFKITHCLFINDPIFRSLFRGAEKRRLVAARSIEICTPIMNGADVQESFVFCLENEFADLVKLKEMLIK